jgi:hypothetical protein
MAVRARDIRSGSAGLGFQKGNLRPAPGLRFVRARLPTRARLRPTSARSAKRWAAGECGPVGLCVARRSRSSRSNGRRQPQPTCRQGFDRRREFFRHICDNLLGVKLAGGRRCFRRGELEWPARRSHSFTVKPRRAAAKLLTRDEARHIAANIAKLPEPPQLRLKSNVRS